MSKICLVRHGETEWNRLGKVQGREDIPLNEFGKSQAINVAKYLRKTNWEGIISSPLIRAYETAKLIAHEINIQEVKIENDLMERDYGDVSGLTLEERTKKWPDRQYTNMEPWYLLRDRVFDCVLSSAQKYENKNIVLVSHGGAINSVLHTLSQGEYGSGITRLHSACVNMLNYKDGKLEVECYNIKVT